MYIDRSIVLICSHLLIKEIMHDQIFFCLFVLVIQVEYICLHDDMLACEIFIDIFLYMLTSSIMLSMGVPTN
jgi:hypothetical protein